MPNVNPFDVFGRKEAERKPKSKWVSITKEWAQEHIVVTKPTKDAWGQALDDMRRAGKLPDKEGGE